MKKQGFTLVEIMIVVLIIGLLAAIAIPNFIKARKTTQMNACIDNLRSIEGGIEQALMAGTAFTEINSAVLFGANAYIKVTPVCPVGKTAYDLPSAETDRPTCKNATADPDYPHVLPGGASGTDTGATDTGT